MEKQIIIINGTGGCGKDTFVTFAQKVGRVRNISSIDLVKELAISLGYQGGKSEKDRKFLSELKRITTEYNDLSFQDISRKVQEFKESNDDILFIHIREPEEIERAKIAFGAKTLLIKRMGYETIISNSSDANVENYVYDFVITNDSLEKLENQADLFIKGLNEKIRSKKLD